MTKMIICDDNDKEGKLLEKDAKNANAHASDTKLKIDIISDTAGYVDEMDEKSIADMAVTAIPENGDTSLPEKVREESDDKSIMLVADESVPPMRYVTPKIKAASLLQRPYTKEEREETVNDFIKDYYQKEASKDERYLYVNNDGERERIPVSQIYYLEVRRNKVMIRMRDAVYVEYTSLDKLLKELGDDFIRCHRSFAFNRNWFDSVKLSDNRIKLAHGVSVPLSRTYKKMIREYAYGDR